MLHFHYTKAMLRKTILFLMMLLLITASGLYGQTTASEYRERAREKYRQADYDGAIAEATKAIELDPAFAETYTYRGIVHYVKKEYADAMVDFERSIEIDPKYSEAYFYRGTLRYLKKDSDGAIADWTKAIDLGSATPYFHRGTLRFMKKDYDGAIADFTKAIQIFPDITAYRLERAKVYRAVGKIDLAKADEEKVAEMEKP